MKKIFFLAATAAIALSSCSKNDISEIATPNDNPNAIGLNIGSFATKAETTTGTLNTDGNKLTIYSYNTTGNFGPQTFTYGKKSDWTNDNNSATWENVKFPLSLYSMNDGATTNGNLVLKDIDAETATLSSPFAVAGNVSVAANTDRNLPDQKDLVYYASRLAKVPVEGKISAIYKHALSRIKMQYKTEDENNIVLHIAKVRLVNVKNAADATMTIAENSTTSVSWTPDTKVANVAYNYYAPEPTIDALNPNTDNSGKDFDATAVKDLFIIPQTFSYTNLTSDRATSAYVEVIYCSERSDTVNNVTQTTPIIGYKEAQLHPEYESMIDPQTGNPIDPTTPLYAKVAFPLKNLTLDAGKYYNFVLDFSGSDIYGTEDDKFVNKDGKEVPGTGGVDKNVPSTGVPVNPSSTSAIGLKVKVLAWPTNPNSTEDLGN